MAKHTSSSVWTAAVVHLGGRLNADAQDAFNSVFDYIGMPWKSVIDWIIDQEGQKVEHLEPDEALHHLLSLAIASIIVAKTQIEATAQQLDQTLDARIQSLKDSLRKADDHG